MPTPTRSPAVIAFWRAYREAAGLDGDDYDLVAFGDSPAMADELAALVFAGTKRATAGLLRDFGEGKEPLPRVGGHAVVVDGRGEPVCVFRTVEARVGPLDSVDAAFAWDEGEGDRTLADWVAGHHRFFRRQAAREGFEFRPDLETVFERFRVVWPPQAAD
ncbi:MAG: ASCH domain-containing protein [Elusimicrobiota bacterium]|nr:ASCH domain-containing protein [Elusimicrobiota bacterium]